MRENIRIATENDIDVVKDFLGRSEVSSEGVESIIDHFIIMEDELGKLQATLGVERIGKDGLLRSLVVTSNIEQTQILTLFKSAVSLAKHKEMQDLYLVTNREASVVFFTMLGFSRVDEVEIPETVLYSQHIRQIAQTDQAIFMKTSL
ncbi:GNAT family N-acetyltransferase [Litchfieldia alkalitelluris]|uniref:GNAT family N-acetyltransferase n=1 Tax=Litchfieldia alkalitelluris TaxID=304268 RepID=UPI0009967891|nr:hypothetical protein [Litchfieldia alkalitelluris]